MKAILLSLAFAIGLGANAQSTDGSKAQTAEHAKKTAIEKAERRTERLATDLGLNADQKVKIGEINLNYAKAMEQVKTIPDAKSRKGREDTLKGNRERGYHTVMTPEQFTKWNSMRAEKKAKHDAEKKDGKKKDNDGDDD
ncbi:MAG: hypothetical protein WAT61_12735 [Flavobacteriales bacterium]|jgi:hypothetical protein|nr:hypothetical protein [Flavobacteriales bacterium]MBP9175291.1 hypothetical protein [Hyphomicrobiales bacterium]